MSVYTVLLVLCSAWWSSAIAAGAAPEGNGTDKIYIDAVGQVYDVRRLWQIASAREVEERITPDDLLALAPDVLPWTIMRNADAVKVSVHDVLENPELYPEHIERIKSADLNQPVLVHDSIVDGYHRLARAKLEGKKLSAIYLSDKGMEEGRVRDDEAIGESAQLLRQLLQKRFQRVDNIWASWGSARDDELGTPEAAWASWAPWATHDVPTLNDRKTNRSGAYARLVYRAHARRRRPVKTFAGHFS